MRIEYYPHFHLKNIFKVSKHFKISHFSDLAISSRVLLLTKLENFSTSFKDNSFTKQDSMETMQRIVRKSCKV